MVGRGHGALQFTVEHQHPANTPHVVCHERQGGKKASSAPSAKNKGSQGIQGWVKRGAIARCRARTPHHTGPGSVHCAIEPRLHDTVVLGMSCLCRHAGMPGLGALIDFRRMNTLLNQYIGFYEDDYAFS